MDIKRLAEIRDGLQSQKELVGKPKAVLDALSVILAFTPISGVSSVLDKVAGRLEPDLFTAVDELLTTVASLAPEIDRIEDHEARLASLANMVMQNKALADQLLIAAERLPQDVLHIDTDGGRFTLQELLLRETRLLAEATGGGSNQFGVIDLQNAPSTFKTGPGSSTEIGSLRASGKMPGVAYDISMPAGHQIDGEGSFQTAIHEVKPNGQFSFVGVRTVRVYRD